MSEIIKIEFSVDTEDGSEKTVAETLRNIAQFIEAGNTGRGIMINGQRVGQWTITPTDLEA